MDKAIMLCIVLAALAVIAAAFIRRAVRYRKTVTGAAVPDGQAQSQDEGVKPEVRSPQQRAKDKYLYHYVFRVQLPFRSSRTVRVRPEYADRIRQIAQVIGSGNVSMTEYVDKVLKAHFDDNRDVINELYRERASGLLKTDE